MTDGVGVDPRAEIDALVGCRGRTAGTDAERRAAEHIAGRLRSLGREAELEPTVVRPRHMLAHILAALIAIVGSVASVTSPGIGAGLVLFAAFSSYGDLTGRFQLLRLLTAKRASQNVVSEESGEKPGLIVLLAHHDAARTGGVFSPRALARRARIGARVRRPFGLLELFFFAQLLVLGCCLVRLLVPESDVLTWIQLVPTALLVASIPLLIDVAWGDVVPGANDNASGVATVLRLLERYGGELDHFDVWAVLAGAEEAQALGMRDWVRRHRRELDRRRTLFVDLDKVGIGTVRYARREGLVLPLGYDRELFSLCEAIAAEDREAIEPRFRARPYVARTAGDAVAARTRGLRAISIACLDELDHIPTYHNPGDVPEQIDDAALERAFGFCCELLERIDDELGPGISHAEAEEAA